ncbi:hypothetical protein KUW18_14180 [Halomonas sp. DP5Y7-2]|uniref:hypothetical protein n=1 Tax=Halomonas sp. DP5Y7-2 TaxID=2859076 RepID=UPI001C9949C7|nr:hypothetical protein [Halomonas sp. DP5Y7-2]MBY5985241.1 hypothetical protein [Halomonas sp. DP5Y7-2]MED5296618.1 hypothetical protein [Pseudomonadota bacterium]
MLEALGKVVDRHRYIRIPPGVAEHSWWMAPWPELVWAGLSGSGWIWPGQDAKPVSVG